MNAETPEERVRKCGEAFQRAMEEYGCRMYTALKLGNVAVPLREIAGFELVTRLTTNDPPTQPGDGQAPSETSL